MLIANPWTGSFPNGVSIPVSTETIDHESLAGKYTRSFRSGASARRLSREGTSTFYESCCLSLDGFLELTVWQHLAFAIRLTKNRKRNTSNRALPIEAITTAISPNPNKAATNSSIKNVSAQLRMINSRIVG
jgi:hypothetical protein